MLLRPIAWFQRGALNPYVLWGSALAITTLVLGPVELDAPTGVALTLPVVILILANFRAAHSAGDSEERRKIYWLSLGLLVVLLTVLLEAALLLLELATGWRIPLPLWPFWLGLLGLGAGLFLAAFAILYRGALDPVLVIQRTVLYGGLAVLMVFLFSGLENLVTRYVVETLGLPSGIGAWIAGGAVALVIGPMHEALSRRVRIRARKRRAASGVEA